MLHNGTKGIALALSSLLIASGCTNGQLDISEAPESRAAFGHFDKLPLPDGSRLDLAQVLVLGSELNWTGRLTFFSNLAPGAIYDIYMTELPRVGWREVMTVRSATSHLVFDSSDRTLTIAIEPGFRQFSETRVQINVIPGGR